PWRRRSCRRPETANARPKTRDVSSSDQRRAQKIDGVERHARAVVGAASRAGAFAPEKFLPVGERNVRLSAREILNFAVGIGDGVKRQSEVAARAGARRPGELVGERDGIFEQRAQRGVAVADKPRAEMLAARRLKPLGQLAAGEVLANRHGFSLLAEQA